MSDIKIKKEVTRKQENSRHCLVCGLQNTFGLKASFYELENGELMAVFTGQEHHQSYPGRLHGGMASAMLDETIGRAIMITEPNTFGVTVDLTLRYKKPVPLDKPLRVIGRIENRTKRTFEGTGEILLGDGTVAVIAKGKYMSMPIDQIMDSEDDLDWKVVEADEEPRFFEY